MTSALATAPVRALAGPEEVGRAGQGGGRLTLEERLGRALETARAYGAADCPLCAGRMEPTPGGAACRGCGSILG